MKATRAIALASVTAIALAACGSDSDAESSEDTTADTAATEEGAEEGAEDGAEEGAEDGAEASAAECPSELVIQTDWYPELEHGGTYPVSYTHLRAHETS